MRRSSKIILAIFAFLLVYVLMVYTQLASNSHRVYTQADSDKFLSELSGAFRRSDTAACLSFAYPDAKVAGRQLEFINNLLHSYFQQTKDPKVDYRDVRLLNDRDFAFVTTDITVLDGTEVKYHAPVTFKLERRETAHLLGLVKVYDWKVVNVDAQIPIEASGF